MKDIENKLSRLRREFHKMPEIGWLEFETTVKIIDYLKKLGYEITYGKSIHSERMGLPTKEEMMKHRDELDLMRDYDISEILEGYTGVVAILDTNKPGDTIAMRFDIDANGIEESDDEEHLPKKKGFRSKNNKAMHACGHDGHISIGLGIAEYLMINKERLNGKFILIFQPAEEGVRGAKSMVDAGILSGVKYLLSGHIGLGVEKGILAIGTVGFLATSKINVYFEGVPSHAGVSPELGKNALLAAASCALNLHTLTQFGAGMSRLNVGVLEAGTSRNIVPHKAMMQIETRGENEEVNEGLKAKVDKVIEGSATAFDVKYRSTLTGGAPSYFNRNKKFIHRISNELQKEGFEIDLERSLGGSEDITYMMNKVEENGGDSIYFIFGTNLSAAHHNNRFDYDEDVLIMAYKAFIRTIEILSK